jgi:ELWxxDGT repeat protein
MHNKLSILCRTLRAFGFKSRPATNRRNTDRRPLQLEALEQRELLSSAFLLKATPETFNDIRYLTSIGNSVFFSARDAEHGRELWKTDGTLSGTVLLHDINPGWDSSNPHDFARLGSDLYFVAWNPQAGESLWKSDGTEAGTVMVTDINPVTYGGPFLFDLTEVNGTLFFVGDDDVHGDDARAN